jgi:hypothetical protein
MEMGRRLPIAVLTACFAANATAAVLYVDVNSATPATPYTNWSTAAAVIQDAVDAANPGDEVLVTNGIYATGGSVAFGGIITNRVLVDKPLNLQSVNGATVTTIVGYQIPGTFYGDQAIRGVYLTNGASIDGFTISNGSSRFGVDFSKLEENQGGGIYCASTNERVSNCIISGNTTDYEGAGTFGGTYNNCVISNNWLYYQSVDGGGACSAVLNNCMISQNYGIRGGGASQSILNNCMVQGNTAFEAGGGTSESQLTACRLIGNSVTNSMPPAFGGGGSYASTLFQCLVLQNLSASYGGGSYKDFIYGCRIISNSASSLGGGTASSVVNNSLIFGNSASSGGGALSGTLNNCTVVGNSAAQSEGGTGVDAMNNCIVYGNFAPNSTSNYYAFSSSSIKFCCTAPLPIVSANFIGNISTQPLFINAAAGDFHFQPDSPCINAGNNAYVTNTADLDGNPRIVGGTVDIGAYEFQSPTSVISYAWLEQYGFPIDGSADFTDPDHDGMNNYQEWIAGTDPTNAASVLKMQTPSNSPPGVAVSWLSVPDRNYAVFRSTNLATTAFITLAANIPGQTNTTSYLDTNTVGVAPFFYRVGVLGTP